MLFRSPAAVGAQFADPGRAVVAVCGDGAFQMQMMELATICQENLSVKVILMKNGSLGMIRELQKNLYHGNYMAVGLEGGPDYIKIAGAYGIKAASIREQSQAEEAIQEMLRHPEMCIRDRDDVIQSPTGLGAVLAGDNEAFIP